MISLSIPPPSDYMPWGYHAVLKETDHFCSVVNANPNRLGTEARENSAALVPTPYQKKKATFFVLFSQS
ncbi:hypothetical protein GWI33_023385 [Rhynchophorus ferrugineus]|uniref:Uncharacterized protein n=1 Tax=Rhynchophorus ferrugineus TaxID=354439 RepID=A0A834HN19_RHYFE|nr:hypothetical protein GWI33_023386 [Rhynchophorus ferrugineus]KAF7264364.1 hypothetical protein GWI33_023385 [Rhynchophorus ferrugineus]